MYNLFSYKLQITFPNSKIQNTNNIQRKYVQNKTYMYLHIIGSPAVISITYCIVGYSQYIKYIRIVFQLFVFHLPIPYNTA